jgi:hypothetical protein
MVVIEEVDDDEEETTTDTRALPKETGEETTSKPAKKVGFKKGFLDDAGEALYPEGSPEGEVSEDVKKARLEQATQKQLDDMQAPKKGAPVPGENEPEAPPPPWYTPDWPKTCQYNTPGCTLYEMGSSGHSSEMHKEMVRKTERWAKAISGTERDIRLSFTSMVDEDLDVLLEHVRDRRRTGNRHLPQRHPGYRRAKACHRPRGCKGSAEPRDSAVLQKLLHLSRRDHDYPGPCSVPTEAEGCAPATLVHLPAAERLGRVLTELRSRLHRPRSRARYPREYSRSRASLSA